MDKKINSTRATLNKCVQTVSDQSIKFLDEIIKLKITNAYNLDM